MTMSPSVDDLLAAGFAMGGERLVAIDLVDTLMLAVDPPVDLLESPDQQAAWWQLQAPRLPAGPMPEETAVRRLRAAIRDVLDARLEQRSPARSSIDDINAASAAAPSSLRLLPEGEVETRWHTEYGGNAALAAIAREVIELMGDAERLSTLRRCANPNCSMLFLAERSRRQWCIGSVCGNRTRVARHYEKTRRS